MEQYFKIDDSLKIDIVIMYLNDNAKYGDVMDLVMQDSYLRGVQGAQTKNTQYAARVRWVSRNIQLHQGVERLEQT